LIYITPFPLELLLHDPIALQIITDLHLQQPEIERIAQSITSISLSAKKIKI
jgi:hypothetical protein